MVFYCICCLATLLQYITERNLDVLLRKMSKRQRNIGRTYRSGNEKRKIKALKENEMKHVSGATKKFVVKKTSPEIE